jgi:Tfp pilus assembly protein PilO
VRGKRAPLIAGAGVAGALLLVLMLLVLPKMNAVTEAKDRLGEAKGQQTTLTVRREALEDAKANAGAARATIEEVKRKIPELADEPGVLLLLQNAASLAGLDVASFGVGEPTYDATKGLSVISVSLAGEGTYFEVADFLYSMETLSRAAKVTAVQLAPSDATGTVALLTVTGTIELYTSDANAGTGSVPGPQDVPAGGV